MDENPDYVTVLSPQFSTESGARRRFCASIMHYDKRAEDYIVIRSSDPLTETAARALAESWAAASHLEIR